MAGGFLGFLFIKSFSVLFYFGGGRFHRFYGIAPTPPQMSILLVYFILAKASSSHFPPYFMEISSFPLFTQFFFPPPCLLVRENWFGHPLPALPRNGTFWRGAVILFSCFSGWMFCGHLDFTPPLFSLFLVRGVP